MQGQTGVLITPVVPPDSEPQESADMWLSAGITIACVSRMEQEFITDYSGKRQILVCCIS